VGVAHWSLNGRCLPAPGRVGTRDVRLNVGEGLLVDAPDAFEPDYVVGVLRVEIARVFGLAFALGFNLPFGAFERRRLAP
jgi:hypothetical protein